MGLVTMFTEVQPPPQLVAKHIIPQSQAHQTPLFVSKKNPMPYLYSHTMLAGFIKH